MTNVTRTAQSTVTTLLGTVSTAANVTTALLNSTNIIALDLQERTAAWAQNARIDRTVAAEDYLETALSNHAETLVVRAEQRQTWFDQNPNRQEAYALTLQRLREKFKTPSQPQTQE